MPENLYPTMRHNPLTDDVKSKLELLASSADQFPFDFDDVWPWVKYSSKQKAKQMLTKHFVSGRDFLLNLEVKQTTQGSGGHNREEICLTTECFKSFAMMAGTEKGREVREYYLECERKLKAVTQPKSALEWAKLFIVTEEERLRLEQLHYENHPKVEAYMDSEGFQNIGTVAQILGYGRNSFFKMLRADGILTRENLPYSQHRHLFAVKTTVIGNGRNQAVALVNPEGMTYLAKRYGRKHDLAV